MSYLQLVGENIGVLVAGKTHGVSSGFMGLPHGETVPMSFQFPIEEVLARDEGFNDMFDTELSSKMASQDGRDVTVGPSHSPT